MNGIFSFDDCADPLFSLNPWDHVKRIAEEHKSQCGQINARLDELQSEFSSLVAAYNVANNHAERVKLTERIDINRDLRETLYYEKWKRT